MDKDSRFAFLVIGLPFIGLIYCLGIIVFFLVSPIAQNHPLITGIIAATVPFSIAAFIWIKASAKAYGKKSKG
ncbi:hypothetical protein VKI21_15090 [Cyanobacterium aponinum UTEX 3222]|uniref:Uncharacterized protein n=3 Tax=Cyanobacterium aponinum TaxID=379064 RepID=K9Z5B1_CYAAP|nr:hypothetical protein [Cyanobacterium aponinum]WRL41357.1 hypothetical protein VKI21_15090 [Cyanobacterium aponinum UTEX 3222]AFZ53740.1 hypothetical protein Cyan10605_1633 [Cyanobacterium aponinum PCC 10605]MBD2393738.1 hypothetical protein [Cyanobacterium aponinum FACHB-4101]MTF39695.1 hypothetical protein [Cyanobacterium aponinum 0216]PHV61928.1 hypothetical protein CSQ80_12840 [Cyanobacterium aponinum IPPAS B-1201]